MSFDPPVAHTGWLKDAASHSVAFVTPSGDRPKAGDQIEVTFGVATPTPTHRAMRVVHTARYDRYFSVVGCSANSHDATAFNPLPEGPAALGV